MDRIDRCELAGLTMFAMLFAVGLLGVLHPAPFVHVVRWMLQVAS